MVSFAHIIFRKFVETDMIQIQLSFSLSKYIHSHLKQIHFSTNPIL